MTMTVSCAPGTGSGFPALSRKFGNPCTKHSGKKPVGRTEVNQETAALAEGAVARRMPDGPRLGLAAAGDDALLEDLVNHACRPFLRRERRLDS